MTSPLDDGDYDPKAKGKTQKKKKVVAEAMPPPSSEIGRPNLYTLPEDHSHMLSTSMDLSFSGDVGFVALPSQVDAYGFDDNLFGAPGIVADGLDIADELARELGEGWGGGQTIEYVSGVEANHADENRSDTGGDLLAQIINGPDMDLDMGDSLQYVDPAVVGLPEPGVSPRERVSGIAATH